jgi:hypothetical protein
MGGLDPAMTKEGSYDTLNVWRWISAKPVAANDEVVYHCATAESTSANFAGCERNGE